LWSGHPSLKKGGETFVPKIPLGWRLWDSEIRRFDGLLTMTKQLNGRTTKRSNKNNKRTIERSNKPTIGQANDRTKNYGTIW